MPLFDYKCTECHDVFEVLGKSEDIVHCRVCLHLAEKLITGCSFKVQGAYNPKMQVKGHVVGRALCKKDRDG